MSTWNAPLCVIAMTGSGTLENETVRAAVDLLGQGAVLMKPFTREHLVKASEEKKSNSRRERRLHSFTTRSHSSRISLGTSLRED